MKGRLSVGNILNWFSQLLGPSEPADPELMAAYRETDTQRRAMRLHIGIWISAIGMMAGVTLDYFVYPEHLGVLFTIRLVATAALFLLLFILFKATNNRSLVKNLGIGMALVDNLAFISMVFYLGGATSPYYAGVNLVLLGMSVLLPWTLKETFWVCLGSIALYAIACAIEGNLFDTGVFSIFFNNTYFLTITSVICVISAHLQTRARFSDFQLRHSLDKRNHELQTLDRLKTNFFSNVTHELRTPLALILGPIDNVLKGREKLTDRQHENLLVAQRNSLRLLKLINDLLDLTRMEQGDNVLSKKTIKLQAYLIEIIDSVRHLATAKGVSLRVEPSTESIYLEADPARLEKVILNLLTNAIKFTSRGGSIKVGHKPLPDEKIAIYVEDNGAGIHQEDLKRIFDRFYQVSGKGGSSEQGVGIGLALAKELVEQHGGQLEVESEPQKGSCFTMILPGALPLSSRSPEVLPHAPLNEPQPAAPAKDREDLDQPLLQAFRSADRTLVNRNTETDEISVSGSGDQVVLVIEDEPDMMRYITGLLTEHFKLVSARDGRNLEYLIETYDPQLILLDWMLPGRDGLTLCREIRNNRSNDARKVVMLTARVDEESKVHALEAGADDFLLKPFSSIELITRIDNLIRNATLQIRLKQSNHELKQTLQKLQETEAHLVQSEKMNALGSLSAGLLHEINNPLNYVFSGIQILEMESESFDPETREMIADIKEGLVRVNDVMKDLTTFAYPEKPGQISDFSLLEAFKSAQKITSKETMGVHVEVHLPKEFIIKGQKTQWMHVFINLLTNAGKALIEHPTEREKEIQVSAELKDGKIELTFRDNGIGIPEAVRKRIFEPFFTTRDVGKGMGMGLSICRTIIENHGGSISVDSEVDHFTIFTIHIPATETNDPK
ncbi:ATP-binding protein [Coraliomargarita algicola]|uniref:histidine kinase n=1 Tax=Coraliomargarita algicola TaxID=3092156 RepID=A0ABZ0RMC6_9BACT|nr:ATP-binding protein [Coraliomargarita sp. J2-16]WPJ96657.1 ATP-binding protein [Coraliomargarita sp. J2-16]